MPKIYCIPAYRDRAPKENPNARCCWVCGKLDGLGFTEALRGAGYRIGQHEIGYAHVRCMYRAQRQAQKRYLDSPSNRE